jgi:membrane fusion protein (multidrug efflux system)
MLAIAGCLSNAEETMAYPPPQVAVMEVVPQLATLSREYVGRTVGSREVDVHARVTGIIEERLYEEGAAVSAGAPLFRLDAKPFEVQVASAEAEHAHALAQLARAERERQRLEPLAEADAVSEKEIDDARSEVDLAAATVKQTLAALRDARIQLGYTTVTAPIAAITGLANKFEGALVTAGSDSFLTTLVQTDPMDVHFSISENEWLAQQRDLANGTVQTPEQSELDVHIILADGTRLERTGHINFSAARIDEATGTYNLRARFPNEDNTLKAGQFVRVVVSGVERPDAIAVPQKAVLEGPQGKFVFVAAAGTAGTSVAQIRPIEVGEWLSTKDGEMWVVRSGLEAGDLVILDNFVKLQPDGPVALLPLGAAQTLASAN